MESWNKPLIVNKYTIHLNIKYHMALYLFVTRINLTVPNIFQWNTFQFLKRFPTIINLFSYIIPVVRCICLFVKAIWLLYNIGNPYSKLITSPPVINIYLFYDTTPLLYHIINPPFEYRLICLPIFYNIFSQFHRVWIILLFKLDPIWLYILELH